jgi:hypothetical protein
VPTGLSGLKAHHPLNPLQDLTDRLTILDYPIRLHFTITATVYHCRTRFCPDGRILEHFCRSLSSRSPHFRTSLLCPRHYGFDHVRLPAIRADQAKFLEQSCTSLGERAPGPLVQHGFRHLARIDNSANTTIAARCITYDAPSSMDTFLVHSLLSNIPSRWTTDTLQRR